MSWSLVLLYVLLWSAAICAFASYKPRPRNRFVKIGRILPPPSPNCHRRGTESVP